MSVLSFGSPAVIVLGGILLVALISVVTKAIVLPLLGIEWPFRRVSAPWRFSLLSITVLVAVAAVILGVLRNSPDASILGLAIVLVMWLTVVRYVAFRRSMADRSHRALATVLRERKNEGSDQ